MKKRVCDICGDRLERVTFAWTRGEAVMWLCTNPTCPNAAPREYVNP